MLNEPKSLIDGCIASLLPADDRGFLFGDHVFETMVSDGKQIPLWSLHWKRLNEAADILGIALPDEQVLIEEAEILVNAQPSIVRMTITRGSSNQGYWVPSSIASRRVIQKRPFPSSLENMREQGLCVHTASISLPEPGPYVGLKHGNRLMQVMLSKHCQDSGCDEALVYRSNGELAEAIASNVILVHNGQATTPSLPEVQGVGLEWLQSKGMGIVSKCIGRDDVSSADEIILVNAVMGARGVRVLDGIDKPLGPFLREVQSVWSQCLP